MNIEPIKIYIDKTKNGSTHIVFRFQGGFEYDPDIYNTTQDWWLDHMRDKNWFTPKVEKEALNILGKTLDNYPNVAPRS